MDTTWIKSSLSFSNGNCVEIASLPGAIGVRDGKDPDGPVLTFPPAAWRAFTAAARAAHVAHWAHEPVIPA